MKKTIVGTQYGRACNTGDITAFPNAKTKECMGCIVPIWPVKRLAIKYYCKVCNRLKH